MAIQLSDHFTYKRLFRFTLPTIVMMIFTSIYGVVDGFFVSNYAGKTPFAAVNLIWPVIMLLGAVGAMFGTGGAALIGKTMGEGDGEKANAIFSMLIYVTIGCGAVIALAGWWLMAPVARLMGAEGELLRESVVYGRIILLSMPAFMLQYEFQCLFVTAEKPKLGLYVTVAAGVTNMVLDALMVGVWRWGAAGAAIATALSQTVGGVVPLVYFERKNGSRLRLGRCRVDGGALFKCVTNGSSEFLSTISMSLVSMLYNVQLMRYAGENGVAAYGVLMYVSMVFQAIFIGYAVGTAPVVSYHFGAQNRDELKSLLGKTLKIIAVAALCMFAAGQLLAVPLSRVFVGYDAALLAMTERAFMIYSFSFLFSGFCIFGSSFFTALNDGLTSAVISFLRTLVFQVAAVLLLPTVFELDGVWLAIVAAEGLALGVTALFLIGKREKYGYWPGK